METEKIGIVTVLYKSETVLDDFFRTLNEQSYKNFILYVVDNKSPDNSLDKGKEFAKSVWFETKFIENDDNYGVAKGNNQGIEAALKDKCDYVLLSNNDVVLQVDTIEKLYLGLKGNNADMAVPKIYFYDTGLIWAAGGKFTRFNGAGVKHFGYNKENNKRYEKNYLINYAPTCFVIINKDVFIKIGMMDEKYFVYYDDVDFVYRTNQKKLKLFYINNSVILHKESTSTGKMSDFTLYYMLRNRIYFAKKHRRFFYILYIENIIWHFLIRNLKMIRNRHQWQLILKAMHDGVAL
jgi:GT2 family glycosyltransferase